ncbi:MAG: hypothetical protein ABR886_08000 [Dehalococcoidales bacterium]|jgi:uncharacterized protein YcfL
MKHLFRLLYLPGCLCLGLLMITVAGCQAPVSITTQPPVISTTQPPANTTAQPVTSDPRINVLPCADDPEGAISFANVALSKGILDSDFMVVRTDAIPHEKGAPYFLVRGKITNTSTTRCWVAYHGYGYDSAGNEVSFTLDAGPIVGIAQIGIEPKSSEIFALHLSWSDNATSFTLHSQKSANMFP